MASSPATSPHAACMAANPQIYNEWLPTKIAACEASHRASARLVAAAPAAPERRWTSSLLRCFASPAAGKA